MRAPDDRMAIWNSSRRLPAWTSEQLDDLDAEHDWHLFAEEERRDWSAIAPPTTPAQRLDQAKGAAREFGDLSLLRQLFPEVAEFLAVPRRQRGERRNWAQSLTRFRCQRALADVERINQIWRDHFGKIYRSRAPTALAIAAQRHGLTEEQLKNFRKNQ